jgi:hypothetical protein
VGEFGRRKRRCEKCVNCLKDDCANDCERVGMLHVSNDKSTYIVNTL